MIANCNACYKVSFSYLVLRCKYSYTSVPQGIFFLTLFYIGTTLMTDLELLQCYYGLQYITYVENTLLMLKTEQVQLKFVAGYEGNLFQTNEYIKSMSSHFSMPKREYLFRRLINFFIIKYKLVIETRNTKKSLLPSFIKDQEAEIVITNTRNGPRKGTTTRE